MIHPTLDRLADVLVNYSTGIQPGHLVRISSPAAGTPLVRALYRKVLAAGGHPMTRLTPDDEQEAFLGVASEEQLKYVNPIARAEVETIDAHITVWAESNSRAMTGIDPRRMGLAQSARRQLLDTFLRRAAAGQLKWVGTLFPTQAAAQDAEMSLQQYEDFVFHAGLLHEPDPVFAWKQVSQRQQRLVDLLQGKSDYRVTASNGTDVRMSVAGRTWINCDGHENFPDGEVFTGPVVDSVEGQINFSFPAVYHGREVQDVRLTFRNGKVVDASAGKGQDYLFSMLDMDNGAKFLGECAIGTNYGIRTFTRNTLFDEKIGGTVHFALGAGYPETGNTNESALHWDMVVDLRNGGSITIDGIEVSRDGRFLHEGLPG
jgi:aminopeptidase